MPRVSAKLALLTAVLVAPIAPTAPMVARAAESAGAAAPSTIRVVARATVAVKPDQAELDLGVTTERKTAAAAVSENDRKMQQVVSVLKKEIGTDGEVKTSELSVSPRFNESSGKEPARVLGYTVTNTIHVRSANVATVGRLLDLAVQAGANTVNRVELTLKNPDAAQAEALRAASGKARARAAAIAEGQGLRVGDVVSMSEGETGDMFATPFESVSANVKREANVVIEPGTVEVAAVVTVIFALKAR